jgi:hypothetical protein
MRLGICFCFIPGLEQQAERSQVLAASNCQCIIADGHFAKSASATPAADHLKPMLVEEEVCGNFTKPAAKHLADLFKWHLASGFQ